MNGAGNSIPIYAGVKVGQAFRLTDLMNGQAESLTYLMFVLGRAIIEAWRSSGLGWLA